MRRRTLKLTLAGALAALLTVMVMSFPGGNPLNLFAGHPPADIVMLRAANNVVSYLPDSLARLLDPAQLEQYLDGEERSDHPGDWARFRNMQLASSTKPLYVRPDGLIKANAARKAMLASQPHVRGAGLASSNWTWIGPGNQGGRIRAILIHPTNPNTIWIGSVGGGIWKSTNAGASWAPVQDFMGNLAVTSLVMDPATPNTLYAATGEGFFNIDAIRGSGIFKSTDGGMTWNQLASTNPAGDSSWFYVNRLAISPSGVLLAATRGGVYRSSDSGKTWAQVFAASDGNGVADVAFAPDNSNFALMSPGANGGTLRVSTNGGAAWADTNLSYTATNFTGRIEVAYGTGGIAYAVLDRLDGKRYGQLYKSTDWGRSWTYVSTPGHLGEQGWYSNAIWVDPSNNNHLIVGGVDLWRSTNGGVSFSQISSWMTGGQYGPAPHADHHAIVSQPGYNGRSVTRIYFGNDGGLYRADAIAGVTPAGANWTNLNNGLGITQFYSGAGHNGRNGQIVGGTQDNAHLEYSGSGTDWQMLAGGDGGDSAVDPTDGNYSYGEYVFLALHRSTGFGQPATFIYNGISDAINQSALFIAPFVLDESNPNRMWAGGVSLWRSENVKAPAPIWKNVINAGSPISAVATGPNNAVFFGTINGRLYQSNNADSASPSFIQRSGSGMPTNRSILAIKADRASPGRVFVGFGGYETGNLWRSLDNGASWTNIHGNLPATPIYTIETSPTNSNNVYVGTEVGIFTSEDGGTTWTAVNDGPANVSVMRLFWLDPTTLVAATHGRGMFKAALATSTLSYDDQGSGSGSVVITAGAISSTCSQSCKQNYVVGSTVTLKATAAAGASFKGWTGACTGTGDCTVILSAGRSVAATFTLSDVTLSYTRAGNGSGSVSFASSGAQTSCNDSCVLPFAPGTAVTLHATPSAGSSFTGWTGACSGTTDCTIAMSAAKTVSAGFALSTVSLSYTRQGTGAGTVGFTSAGSTTTCADSCNVSFNLGAAVTLHATASAGSSFNGWTGACSGNGDCTVTMSGDASVTAAFIPVSEAAVTYTRAGNGLGSVDFNPAGSQSSCDASCVSSFPIGSKVKVTARAAAGSFFAGWTGACKGGRTCSLTMTASQSIGATFNLLPVYTVTYMKIGDGSGTVGFQPSGDAPSCTGDCSNSYPKGSVVILTATPADGSLFKGWKGGCKGKKPICKLTVKAAKLVTANFAAAVSGTAGP